jgi:hypothetical protein
MNRMKMDCVAARCGFDWPATERELRAYLHTVVCAVDLANRGRVRDGYAYLLAGAMEGCTAARHMPWAEALEERYREAMASFDAQFGAPYCRVRATVAVSLLEPAPLPTLPAWRAAEAGGAPIAVAAE